MIGTIKRMSQAERTYWIDRIKNSSLEEIMVMAGWWEPHLDERDLRIDSFSAGVNSPIHVKITHMPTGTVGEATDTSRIKARSVALGALIDKLFKTRIDREQKPFANPVS